MAVATTERGVPPRSERFLRTLIDLKLDRETGILDVESASLQVLVFIQTGVPVYVSGGPLGDTLGTVLQARSDLDSVGYADILDQMGVTAQTGFRATAIQLGYVTDEQVDDALHSQVQAKLLHVASLRQTSCRFEPQTLVDGIPHHPTDVLDLVLEGVRRFYNATQLEDVVSRLLDHYPSLVGASERIAHRFSLSRSRRQWLQSIDGRQSVRSLLSDPRVERIDGCRLIAALELSRCAHFGERPKRRTTSAIRFRDGWNQPRGELFTTDRPQPITPSVVDQVNELDNRTAESNNWFNKGRAALRARRFKIAHKLLLNASNREPRNIEYELSAMWALLQTLTDPVAISDTRLTVGQLVLRAVRADPKMAFPHYVQGHIALNAKHYDAALRHFQTALDRDPTDADAQRYISFLHDRQLAG
ncbi:MAG: tetratricopeptide repeat protein [Polyangiaceae bacterium]|nr:tetratricopeptide repeat protein [Polyangiaceae bacterium]